MYKLYVYPICIILISHKGEAVCRVIMNKTLTFMEGHTICLKNE